MREAPLTPVALPVAIIFFTFQRYIVRTGAGATKE
jgi:ABC-type maltose transport system permease subunit